MTITPVCIAATVSTLLPPPPPPLQSVTSIGEPSPLLCIPLLLPPPMAASISMSAPAAPKSTVVCAPICGGAGLRHRHLLRHRVERLRLAEHLPDVEHVHSRHDVASRRERTACRALEALNPPVDALAD